MHISIISINFLLHWSHLNGFFLLRILFFTFYHYAWKVLHIWMVFLDYEQLKWTFKWTFCENCLLQNSQKIRFSWVWISKWTVKLHFSKKSFLQTSHEEGFSLVYKWSFNLHILKKLFVTRNSLSYEITHADLTFTFEKQTLLLTY